MEYSSKTLKTLVEAFSSLPGIGEKSAQRIALYLLREGKAHVEVLAQSLLDLQNKVGKCSICFNLTEDDPCDICRDPKRNDHQICVVEEPKDFMALEKAGVYRGKYHILGGVLSPLDGVGEGQLTIEPLLERVRKGDVSEVILATNPTMEGEMTASHLSKKIKQFNVKVTRIARGVPFGGSLEFNDAITLAKSLEGRSELE